MAFELFTHEYEGQSFRIALDKSAVDPYTISLRTASRQEPFMKYILRRAAQELHTLKIADVGANVGAISLPLAAHGLRVLAIEAVPQNFLALVTSAHANRFANMLPINIAAYSGPALVDLSGTTAATSIGEKATGRVARVAANSLVAILETFGFADLDFIKLDIEGAELAALTGIDGLLAARHDLEIIFESNSHTSIHFGHDQQALAAFFETRGFDLYAFFGGGLMPIRAGDATPSHLMDVLATKKRREDVVARGLPLRQMSDDLLLASLLREASAGHHMRTAHVRYQDRYVRPDLKMRPEWSAIQTVLAAQHG